MSVSPDLLELSKENAVFWDELCGSHLAKSLGITDRSERSLKVFDNWYFNYYPYLEKHIEFQKLEGKNVLEVGLGYGSVSQKLVESGAIYTGLDVAEGPVDMVNHRISQSLLTGRAVKGSILSPTFDQGCFDTVIAIGCLHHTGDLELAISNCLDLLKENGQLVMMVYYAYSYRRWRTSFFGTSKYFIDELTGMRGVVGKAKAKERSRYDINSDGQAAPHTDWISKKSMRTILGNYSPTSVEMHLENMDEGLIPREFMINTPISKFAGLDLYITVKK